MKYIYSLLIACCLFSSGFAKSDKFKGRATLGSIQDFEVEKSDVEYEGIKFFTTQGGADFDGIMRVSLEMTTKEKVVYWAKTEVKAPKWKNNSQGKAPDCINWIFAAPITEMKRPKITGYAIEFGYNNDDEFVVLDADYDDVDTAEELEERNKDSQKLNLKGKNKINYDGKPLKW